MDTPGARLKAKLAAGQSVAVVNPDYPSPGLVEFLGSAGLPLDAIMIDTEQGSADVETVEEMARAARLTGLCSLVRTFSPEPWAIERLMFRGLDGIVVPRVDSGAQARRVVEAVRYCFPADHAGKVVVVQIESKAAFDDLDAFLAVEGIDALFVGPVDLSKSLGYRGDYSVPEVEAVIVDTLARTQAAGRAAGMLVRTSDRRSWPDAGARFLYFHVNDWITVGARAFPGAR